MRIVTLLLLIGIYASAFSQVDTIMWQRLAPLPDSISVIQSGHFLIDSDFYIVGGWKGVSVNFSNDVWQYHIPTDSWSKKSNLPFGGSASSCSFVLNGKGYFLTARDSANNFECDSLFWKYDPITDSWTQLAKLTFAPRQNSASFVYGGKGYIGQTYGCISSDSYFWEYDPILDQWSPRASIPNIITGGSASAISLNHYAYVIGGYNLSFNFVGDIWRYNIPIDQWDSIGQIPGCTKLFPVFWGFDSVLIGGAGVEMDSNLNSFIGNDFYSYDSKNNLWHPIVFNNFIDSVVGGYSFEYNDRGYYFGGISDQSFNSTQLGMWSFDASKYIHNTNVGIAEVKNEATFTVYPNPVSRGRSFSISTSESGEIVFFDGLGRVVDTRTLARGLNPINLSTENEVLFYRATLHDGATRNGKIVVLN